MKQTFTRPSSKKDHSFMQMVEMNSGDTKKLTSETFKFDLIEHNSADLTEEERFQTWKKKSECSMFDFA
ncbi:MAG: hypothetical protein EOO06_20190 [Chitinophagaceae bacterium]|nr:MAG: hypothetical protein EOO06_20190 [Chitinophagaceae bacterium]